MKTQLPVGESVVAGSRERLDKWVQEIMAWHFDPTTGCPFWLNWADKAGWDPRTEVAALHSGRDVLEEMAAIEADEIDLSDTILEVNELPEDSVRTHDAIAKEDIPFVDLSEEE